MQRIVEPTPVKGTVTAPSSKSYSQRAIAAALLAQGVSTLRNLELCSDTEAALRVSQALGAEVISRNVSELVLKGGLNPRVGTIDVGESGLSARMFSPIASLSERTVTIKGSGSLLRRPMDMIADPLRRLGVKVTTENGLLPISVTGPLNGGETVVDGSVSSQFITGLLMALPLARQESVFTVDKAKSLPYLDMTLDTMKHFGVEATHKEYREFYVEGGQRYLPCTYNVEGDWSGAAFILTAAALAGEVTVENLNPVSLQADLSIIEALSRAGTEIITSENSVHVRKPEKLKAFTFDATNCPDLFPVLAALASAAEGTSVLTGTERLRWKESNRAEVLELEFGKLGIEIDNSGENIMRITGGRIRPADTDSHGDHRIAMALAVAALAGGGKINISGAESVTKSYPDFWDDLDTITGKR